MSASLMHNGLPEGINRNQLRRAVKVASRQIYRLPSIATEMIDYLFDHVQDRDFERGAKCGCWQSARNIAQKLDRSERRISEAEKVLSDAGWIERTNGRSRRCGDRQGNIQWFIGLSLAPLINRAAEIIAEVAAFERARALKDKALVDARLEIKGLRRQIREAEDNQALVEADKASNKGRTSRIDDLAELESMAMALEAIVSRIAPHSCEPYTANQCAENRAPNTISKPNSKSCSAAAKLRSRPNEITVS